MGKVIIWSDRPEVEMRQTLSFRKLGLKNVTANV